MDADTNHARSLRQRALRALISIAGVGSILGSVAGFPDFELCFSPECGYNPPPSPPTPVAYFEPSRVTVQAGASVTFEVRTANINATSYQWCRVPSGGSSCTMIPSATGPTYTVTGANLADDGAHYSVIAIGTGGTAQASVLLAVSTMPPVIYQDGEFLDSDWEVAPVGPVPGGSTYSALRSPTGGNPGAFRTASYSLGGEPPDSIRIAYVSLAATYDPAVQGAIYTIDFTEECTAPLEGPRAFTAPLIRQAGRTFSTHSSISRWCRTLEWVRVLPRNSLRAADFVQIDGPACGAGETCPDFSSLGAPISLGLLGSAEMDSRLYAGLTAFEYAHGFDNWKVSVWRR